MGNCDYCVPSSVNSGRNFHGVKCHSLPKDKAVFKAYKKLKRNDNLKEFSGKTRIYGNHFPVGERMSGTQLPPIFPDPKHPAKFDVK